MATIKRDIALGKDKKVKSVSPQLGTTATKLRGTPSYPSKTNSSPKLTPNLTAPQKHTPSHLQLARNPNIDVSKQLGKKPTSTVSVQKPTVSRIRPSDKTTLTTTRKTRVPTNVSHGSTSVSGKTGVSQKLVPSQNVKVPVKDVGKRGAVRPVSTVKKSGIKKKEAENSTTSATKEQLLSSVSHEKVENSNISIVPKPEPPQTFVVPKPEPQPQPQPYVVLKPEPEPLPQPYVVPKPEPQVQPQPSVVPKPEPQPQPYVVPKPEPQPQPSVLLKPEPQPQQKTQPQDQESCIPKAEEQIIQVVNNNDKGTYEENQDFLDIGQIESGSNDKDTSHIVIAEDKTVSEHQDASTGIKTDEAEDKLHIEQTSKQEELDKHNMNEVIRSNNDENIAHNLNNEDKEDVEEKKVVEVQETTLDNKEEKEVKEVQEIAMDKNKEVANESKVNESKETEGQKVVEEKKQEARNLPPKGKKESAVSNNVIEETASKLREQRKNRVRALAGAFESVISQQ